MVGSPQWSERHLRCRDGGRGRRRHHYRHRRYHPAVRHSDHLRFQVRNDQDHRPGRGRHQDRRPGRDHHQDRLPDRDDHLLRHGPRRARDRYPIPDMPSSSAIGSSILISTPIPPMGRHRFRRPLRQLPRRLWHRLATPVMKVVATMLLRQPYQSTIAMGATSST